MDMPFRPLIHSRRAALLATACMIFPLAAGEPGRAPDAARQEAAARYEAVGEARFFLEKGDQAYAEGKFGDAVQAYAGARDLIPAAPLTAELRDAATERYALASIAHSRDLVRRGDLATAKSTLDQVLSPGVAPDHALTLLARAELDDPIRTNPALTAEHAANVDAVRRLLYTAEGAVNLGNFAQAKALYEDVIRIDPYNRAARRGMERIASHVTNYQRSAFDHTRAEMLAQVDAAWELPVPLPRLDLPLGLPGTDLDPGFIPVANKLDRIIIPAINLEQASLNEALDFLRLRAAEFDTLELDPERRGVNFTLDIGGADSPFGEQIRAARFDLRLNNVPLGEALRYVTDLTRTQYVTDAFSVIIRPRGADAPDLITRNYRVPPDFLTTLSSNVGGAEAAAPDPFAAPRPGGLIPRRLGAQEALQGMGIAFPEGARATFNAASSTLNVVNTAGNHSMIEQIVDSLSQTEPVMITVRVKVIRIQETRLKELGFDWLLSPTGFGGASWIPGADRGYLSGGTQGNGGDLSDIALPPGQFEQRPITAGNRSGTGAITGDSIDDLLIGGGGRQDFQARAPGVFQLSRVMSDSTIQMMMRGLNQQTGVDTMATPSVVTRSGQTASVRVVREFIYPSEYEPPQLPNTVGESGGISPVTPANPTSFNMREVGIVLEVLPTATDDKRYIDITLSPEFVNFDGFINYGSPINTPAPGGAFGLGAATQIPLTDNAILQPVFSVMRSATSVTVADGATLVFGGLLQNRIQNVQDQTPILGSLPIFGRLFQTSARQPSSTAIIFFVNVELTDPGGRSFRDQ
jgi:general secretion pathway protein D